MSYAPKTVVDCATGRVTQVPLTPGEIAERDAEAAAQAVAAAAQAVADQEAAVRAATIEALIVAAPDLIAQTAQAAKLVEILEAKNVITAKDVGDIGAAADIAAEVKP